MIKNIKILNNYNQRLDKYLKQKYTSLTQGFIQKNIRKKNILINNSITKANYLIKPMYQSILRAYIFNYMIY